jgi:meso-butanediol dehydrogenase/(S,S)-butanediol dehydrogenase/diacetyl reductase
MTSVLVTGGSSGIGEALVRQLVASGCEVTFTFRQGRVKAEALSRATGAVGVHYDQRAPQSVSQLAALIRQGTFDGLVHNAGEPVPRQLLLRTDAEQFLAYQVAALHGTLATSCAFAEQARCRGAGGAIVTVLSSVTLGVPPAKLASYVTSKHALLGLTKSMAVEFVRYGVRVNAVSPGMTRTDFNAELPQRFIEQLESALPLQRLASVQEVAAVIQFLLSPEASYVTGANVPVTGGVAC